jgi:uncharacterized protein with HEPN domain
MSRDSRERLQDILEALDAIARYVGGSLAEPTVDDRSCSMRCSFDC